MYRNASVCQDLEQSESPLIPGSFRFLGDFCPPPPKAKLFPYFFLSVFSPPGAIMKLLIIAVSSSHLFLLLLERLALKSRF
jgi:hypothetical protein